DNVSFTRLKGVTSISTRAFTTERAWRVVAQGALCTRALQALVDIWKVKQTIQENVITAKQRFCWITFEAFGADAVVRTKIIDAPRILSTN
ncbi:hypothetical protein BIW11_07066, partial [Tropilaelaps mercedesae]